MSVKKYPGGEWELKADSGETIKGKFSMWALKAFCMQQGCEGIGDMIRMLQQKGKKQYSTATIIVDLILWGARYQWKQLTPHMECPYTRLNASAWIEHMGYEEAVVLFNYAFSEDRPGKVKKAGRGRSKDKTTWTQLEQLACKAGLTPAEFLHSSLPQVYAVIEGYRGREADQWEQTRLLAYQVFMSVPRKEGYMPPSLYEFMPLSSDPTPEQREQIEEERRKEQYRAAKRLAARYVRQGVLSPEDADLSPNATPQDVELVASTKKAMQVFKEKGWIQ